MASLPREAGITRAAGLRYCESVEKGLSEMGRKRCDSILHGCVSPAHTVD